jgi:hypothetical protein
MAKNKDKKTRGQMAEARRMSAQAGRMLAYSEWTKKNISPGVGIVYPKTGTKLTVSDELARFGAFPEMGGVSARQYENPKPKKKKSK